MEYIHIITRDEDHNYSNDSRVGGTLGLITIIILLSQAGSSCDNRSHHHNHHRARAVDAKIEQSSIVYCLNGYILNGT